MCVRLMNRVFESALVASLKQVATPLAFIAAPDGGSLYPSVEYLSWLSGRSVRGVQNVLTQLRALGILEVVDLKSPIGTVMYQFRADRLPRRPAWRSKQEELPFIRDAELEENLRFEQANRLGQIYVVQFGDLVKIGFTVQFEARLAQLKNERLGAECTPLAVVVGPRHLESQLHWAWRHLKVSGEWYRADRSLLRWAERFQQRSTVSTVSTRQPPTTAVSAVAPDPLVDPSDLLVQRGADAPQVFDLNAEDPKYTNDDQSAKGQTSTGAERPAPGGSQTDNRADPETDRANVAALFDQRLRRLPLRAKLDLWRARAGPQAEIVNRQTVVSDGTERKR